LKSIIHLVFSFFICFSITSCCCWSGGTWALLRFGIGLVWLSGMVGRNFGCGGRHGWAEFWLGWAAWLGGILAVVGGMVGRNFGWAAWLALSNLNELHSNECAFNQLDGL
jgi:hypothetical protein